MTHIITTISSVVAHTVFTSTIQTTPLPPPPPPWPWPNIAPALAPSPLGLGRRAMVYLPVLPLVDSAFDVATVSLILVILLLSLLSVFFILHLRFKSRSAYQLQNFSSHSTVRFLLIIFISLWAIGEFLRLPHFRRQSLLPFIPPVSFTERSQFCKLHVVFSLGLLEPGFLITLLVLVNISIRKKSRNNLRAIGVILMTCIPLCICLYLSVFYLPSRLHLPPIFYRNSVSLVEVSGQEVIICTYPLLSTAIFGVFGGAYALFFTYSCWKVGNLAINMRLKARIKALAGTVLICLFVQIALLCLSVLWGPEEEVYYFFVLIVFASVVVCAAVGEGVLVIRPITDALSVGGDSCRWEPGERQRQMRMCGGPPDGSGSSRLGMRVSP